MKIVALINIVPDIEQLSKKEWEINNLRDLETSYIPKIYDIYNDTLLEMLLRFKSVDNSEKDSSLFTLSVGNSSIDYFLRNIYSFNVDGVIRIERLDPLLNDYRTISEDLFFYMKEKNEFDIILSGSKGEIDGSGLTGYRLAKLLNYNVVDNVINIQSCDSDEYVEVTCEYNESIVTRKVATPFVGIVSDVPDMFLRIPSLKQKMIGKKKKIEVVQPFVTKKPTYPSFFDGSCQREHICRNGSIYPTSSSKDTLKYLKDIIESSKQEQFRGDSLTINMNDSKVYLFENDKMLIYFCSNDSVFYQSFIEWNLEEKNLLFMDVTDIVLSSNSICLNKKIYAKNLIASINIPFNFYLNSNKKQVVSLCGSKDLLQSIMAEFKIKGAEPLLLIELLKKEYELAHKTEILESKKKSSFVDLRKEKVVIAIGRGIGNQKNLKAIQHFALENEVILVGTRQAAMNGFVSLTKMVGVSGQQIAPNLLICIGLSGAPAFFDGVRNSDKIIAINKDPNAPIMDNANVKMILDVSQLFENADN